MCAGLGAPAPARPCTTPWPECNAARRWRGVWLIWLDREMEWLASPRGRPGRSETHSAAAVQVCLLIKVLFGLALRRSEPGGATGSCSLARWDGGPPAEAGGPGLAGAGRVPPVPAAGHRCDPGALSPVGRPPWTGWSTARGRGGRGDGERQVRQPRSRPAAAMAQGASGPGGRHRGHPWSGVHLQPAGQQPGAAGPAGAKPSRAAGRHRHGRWRLRYPDPPRRHRRAEVQPRSSGLRSPGPDPDPSHSRSAGLVVAAQEDGPAARARTGILQASGCVGRAVWTRMTGWHARSRTNARMRRLTSVGAHRLTSPRPPSRRGPPPHLPDEPLLGPEQGQDHARHTTKEEKGKPSPSPRPRSSCATTPTG